LLPLRSHHQAVRVLPRFSPCCAAPKSVHMTVVDHKESEATMETAVLMEIENLRRASLATLREKFREVFQEETRSRHREHLFRRIAWRLQALGCRSGTRIVTGARDKNGRVPRATNMPSPSACTTGYGHRRKSTGCCRGISSFSKTICGPRPRCRPFTGSGSSRMLRHSRDVRSTIYCGQRMDS
jgi:hypothetical protein